jgi:hypothetical protein
MLRVELSLIASAVRLSKQEEEEKSISKAGTLMGWVADGPQTTAYDITMFGMLWNGF